MDFNATRGGLTDDHQDKFFDTDPQRKYMQFILAVNLLVWESTDWLVQQTISDMFISVWHMRKPYLYIVNIVGVFVLIESYIKALKFFSVYKYVNTKLILDKFLDDLIFLTRNAWT